MCCCCCFEGIFPNLKSLAKVPKKCLYIAKKLTTMVAARVFRYFKERKTFSPGYTPKKYQNLNANNLQNIFASILAASWRQASMCAGGFTRRWSRSRPVLCIVYDVSSCAYYELWSRSRLVFQTNCIPHVHSDRIL